MDDPWSNYYKHLFWENHCTLVDFVIPGLNLFEYKEGEVNEHFTALLKVTKIIKTIWVIINNFQILPRCVTSEWTILLKEILEKNSFNTVSTVLTYILILLCDFGGSGAHLEPLKFCLHNYATILLWVSFLMVGRRKTKQNIFRRLTQNQTNCWPLATFVGF